MNPQESAGVLALIGGLVATIKMLEARVIELEGEKSDAGSK